MNTFLKAIILIFVMFPMIILAVPVFFCKEAWRVAEIMQDDFREWLSKD